MKILVCISKTPDTTSKISFIDNNSKFDDKDVVFIINPYDEWYALVRGIELKEADPSITLHLMFVGTSDIDPIIRKCFALGGEQAIRIDCMPQDSMETAFQIATYIQDNPYDLILCGKETIDFNNGAVGAMIAAKLDIPHFNLASELTLNDTMITVKTEVDGGTETYSTCLPALVCCQKGMAEQRIANMRNIIASKTKPIQIVPPYPFTPNIQNVNFELPPPKSGVKLYNIETINDLVQTLHQDLKLF